MMIPRRPGPWWQSYLWSGTMCMWLEPCSMPVTSTQRLLDGMRNSS